MDRATGLLLVILGGWLIVASLAGRLSERIISLVWPTAGQNVGDPGGRGGKRAAFEGWIRQYFPPEDHPWAFRVVECESGWDPNVVNPVSGASGLFQHIPGFWAERSRLAGWRGADIFDPEANIAVAAWLHRTEGPQHWECQ